MEINLVSIIYANRNRDLQRIEKSFDSLQTQNDKNFEVIFVDYGSEDALVLQLQDLAAQFDFVRIYFLKVNQLLWNKSKALNYGIKKANGDYVFIADIDLVFHQNTTQLFQNIKANEKFQLFKMGYLDNNESRKLNSAYNFKELKPDRFGEVNGMIFTSKENLMKVYGLDEFFHFYGAEDEDLFARLENVGLEREYRKETYFYHNWHQSFSGSEDKLLTGNPRVKNIMRINQRHFLRNRENGIIKPRRQNGIGKIITKEESDLLLQPTKIIKIYNILSHVEHFLREELPSYTGEIIKVEFVEDPYFHTLKHKLKKLLGKQTQPYCSLKGVNDMILKEILFKYRDANYSFEISENLKSIMFCIRMK